MKLSKTKPRLAARKKAWEAGWSGPNKKNKGERDKAPGSNKKPFPAGRGRRWSSERDS